MLRLGISAFGEGEKRLGQESLAGWEKEEGGWEKQEGPAHFIAGAFDLPPVVAAAAAAAAAVFLSLP